MSDGSGAKPEKRSNERCAKENPEQCGQVWYGLIEARVPNGPRLSCGALQKDSFHNLRAPAASSAC